MSDAFFSSLVARSLLLMKEQKWLESLQYLSQAEQISRRDYGPHDKRLAAVLDKLAVVYSECGRKLDAERAMHESTQIALLHLRRHGRSLAKQQKYSDAEKAYREALGICGRAFGERHPETATCLDNLSTNLRSQSRYIEAMTYCKRAHDIRLAVYGDSHGHTAASFSNLGHLYRLIGQHNQAHALLAKSLVVRKLVYGPEHHYVAESLDRLASLFRDLARFDEAIAYGQDAVRIRRASLGPDHPLTAASMHNLALSHERRSGDASRVVRETDNRQTAASEAAPGHQPRENHSPGYAIFGAIAIGLAVAVLTFTYVPWIGMLVGLFTIVLVGLDMLGLVSIDAGIRKGFVRARGLMAEPQDVDRDAVILGDGATTVGVEARARKGLLSADDARELIRTGKDPLDLYFVHSLTQAAADELAKHRGTLILNNLREVRSKLAKSLRWHQGRLELNGVPELTEAAAAHISRHSGDLCLSGLRELPQAVAQHLAHHKGSLDLTSIKSINEPAANWIIKHRGTVKLTNCRLISEETRRILRTNPQIEFPDQHPTGLMSPGGVG